MLRKKKNFEWPKKLYDKPRIVDENKLVKKYGLKNKREIWRTETKIKYFRNRAKLLITSESKEQEHFFEKLNEIGLDVKSIADVLALEKEDLLKRRLSSIVWKKGLADSAKQARQKIVHKKILISGKAIDAPSYLVKVNEENLITLKKKIKKKKVEVESENNEEINQETKEGTSQEDNSKVDEVNKEVIKEKENNE
jgi:small subunit ribosomal protein S4